MLWSVNRRLFFQTNCVCPVFAPQCANSRGGADLRGPLLAVLKKGEEKREKREERRERGKRRADKGEKTEERGERRSREERGSKDLIIIEKSELGSIIKILKTSISMRILLMFIILSLAVFALEG